MQNEYLQFVFIKEGDWEEEGGWMDRERLEFRGVEEERKGEERKRENGEENREKKS